ncbi:CapA family protein [Undibacterium sp. SXout11W]|uniref:CapA family protein n=1 Tax=Undibacterium sp. SXout11W TaxID=3413050 RepID=UPI003BF0D7AE
MNFISTLQNTGRLIAIASCLFISSNVAFAASTETSQTTVSMLFAGDIVLDGVPAQWIRDKKDPLAAYSAILASTDIRIGNLECVVATTGEKAEKIFTFRGHPSALPTLHQYFDAVSLANNHSGDFGRSAFTEMLGYLEQQKLSYFGGGRNLNEAHKPLIIERKGIRIALLAYDEFMPRSFEAAATEAGVAWSEDDEQVINDIQHARLTYRADVVIPFMHWGWENEPLSGERQHQLAHRMIDAGADAVIGGHPHVTQDIEQYKGKPIIYSIGNFMIDSLDNEPQTRGWVVRLEVSASGIKAWDTRLARLSDDGIPSPEKEAMTPCWDGQGETIQQCSNAETRFIPH